MDVYAITAITNFALACETCLLAGMFLGQKPKVGSAAWFWGGTLIFFGVGALFGGIDHGFLEPHGDTQGRSIFRRIYFGVMGLMTLCILMTIAKQFWNPRVQTIALILGIVQFAVYLPIEISSGKFVVVLANYAPVVLLLLIANFVGLGTHTGSWTMIVGVVITFIASGIHVLGIDTFYPLDRTGLSHVVAMIGIVFYYLGGLDLKIA